MSEEPKMDSAISVVIPCYNRANLVTDAVRSVFSQTHGRHEVIVVDDNSTDDLEGALKPYMERITLLRKTRNEGVSAARNDGLNAATGEYISFLDSDDVWLPNKSLVQLRALLSHPDCAMAVSGCEYMDIDNRQILTPTLPEFTITYSDLCIYTAIPGSASNVLIRRAIFDEIGGFDPTLHNSEDRDLWMRIAEKYKICPCREITARIRIHDSPRKNRQFSLMLENRRTINSKIRDRAIKRKADAWMYFSAYLASSGKSFRTTYYLLRSFTCYPLRVHRKLNRLSPVLERLLPKPLHELLARIKRRLAS